MAVRVVPRAQASEDIRELGSNALKLEVMMYLLRLETEPFLGTPLENRPEIGDLSDCRKLYVDERRHRIIYRLVPNERKPKEVDVIAVGRRELYEVYIEAVKRLERQPAVSS